jgi:hypothetical protein
VREGLRQDGGDSTTVSSTFFTLRNEHCSIKHFSPRSSKSKVTIYVIFSVRSSLLRFGSEVINVALSRASGLLEVQRRTGCLPGQRRPKFSLFLPPPYPAPATAGLYKYKCSLPRPTSSSTTGAIELDEDDDDDRTGGRFSHRQTELKSKASCTK